MVFIRLNKRFDTIKRGTHHRGGKSFRDNIKKKSMIIASAFGSTHLILLDIKPRCHGDLFDASQVPGYFRVLPYNGSLVA